MTDTGFSYTGFFRIEKDANRLKLVLFPDITELKDLPPNYHQYVDDMWPHVKAFNGSLSLSNAIRKRANT
jgi:hypothetical protein